MRRLILSLCLAVLPWASAAQVTVHPTANTFLVWDHDGVNVERFLLWIDDETLAQPPTQDLGLPPRDAAGSYAVPFPSLPPGPHTLTVRAGNSSGLSAPFTLSVTVAVAVPSAPTNGRVETR